MNHFVPNRQSASLAVACVALLAGCQATTPAAPPARSGLFGFGIVDSLRNQFVATTGLGTPAPAAVGQGTALSHSESTALSHPDLQPVSAETQSPQVTQQYPVARLLKYEKLVPSNDRDWVAEHKLLARADFGEEGKVRIENVRNAEWLTAVDCLVKQDDRAYDLADLQSVDFIVVPFENKSIAHTMLSFGFGQGDYLGISAEVRVEKGESYNAALGLGRQFELIYVVADEHDLLPVRVKHRKADVYIYRTVATPDQSRAMFKDVMNRVNQLHTHPEFYDTLSNNCTTNIVRHVNALAPNRVPFDFRVLLPGYSDQLAYELGLFDQRLPFPELKKRSWANERIVKYERDADFSAKIRR